MTKRHKLVVGDRVKIVNFCPTINGKIGYVTNLDGCYVDVRLRWQRHPYDWNLLENEVIHYPKGD